jgi:hypothetical protein
LSIPEWLSELHTEMSFESEGFWPFFCVRKRSTIPFVDFFESIVLQIVAEMTVEELSAKGIDHH